MGVSSMGRSGADFKFKNRSLRRLDARGAGFPDARRRYVRIPRQPQGYAIFQTGGHSLSQRCEICGKGPATGNNVSHSKVRTRRRFLPNLQAATITRDGRRVKARVCTRCLRTLAKTAV